jgi:predicted FMN-binding regulatory protein PaiB
MWVHDAYDDASPDEIRRFVRDWPLAVVIATHPELRVADAPVQLRTGPDGRDELVGHVAAVDPFASSLLNELQAFTMAVDSVEAKVKMSQNRTEADRARVMSMLDGATTDGAAAALQLMRDRFDSSGVVRPR